MPADKYLLLVRQIIYCSSNWCRLYISNSALISHVSVHLTLGVPISRLLREEAETRRFSERLEPTAADVIPVDTVGLPVRMLEGF